MPFLSFPFRIRQTWVSSHHENVQPTIDPLPSIHLNYTDFPPSEPFNPINSFHPLLACKRSPHPSPSCPLSTRSRSPTSGNSKPSALCAKARTWSSRRRL